MTRSNDMNREVQERAALYVAGALTRDETESFETAVHKGEPEVLEALAMFNGASDRLLDAIDPVDPSPALRDRILNQRDSEQQIWRSWESDKEREDELFTLPASGGSWEPTGVEGIDVRRLFIDRPNNRMTAMFRMAPGTAYFPHVHGTAEECYVLEGDLHVGDEIVMHAGDYQRAAPGSTHGVQRTEKGCVLLIVSGLDDEVVHDHDH